MLDRSELVLDRQQSRLVDQVAVEEFGMHSLMLMENAGRQCFETIQRVGIKGPVVVCCGGGNNGGDGYVIARHLRIIGVPTRVLMVNPPDQLSGDARVNFDILAKTDCEIVCFDSSLAIDQQMELIANVNGQPTDLIVDAMLGTGTKGAARSPVREIIPLVNSLDRRVVAIDIPSGLDCDQGVIDAEHTIRATINCTFVSRKPCHQFESARDFCGQIEVLDIGVPSEVVERVLRGS